MQTRAASLLLFVFAGINALSGWQQSGSSGGPRRGAVEHYQRAAELFQGQEFSRAAEECQQATRLQPAFTQAYDLWGTALLNLGDLDAAEVKFKEALKYDPKNLRSRANLSFTYYGQKKQQLAAREARAVLSVKPGDPLANLVAGLIAYLERHPAEAMQHLGRAGPLVDRSPEAMFALARLHLYRHERRAGLKFVQTLAALPKLSKADRFELGRLYSEYDLQDDAAKLFDQLIQQFPTSYEARYNLALALFLGDKIEQASDVLQGLVTEASRPEAYDLLAACYEALNKNADAARAYEKAIELDPTNEDYYLRWGQLAMNLIAYETGIKNLLLAAQKLPQSYRIRLHLGRLYQAYGNAGEAEKCFREAIALDRRYPLSWALLAMFFQSTGQFLEALRIIRSGASENPNDYLLPYVHALILWRGSLEKAGPVRQEVEALLRKSIAVNGNFVESRYLLGRLLLDRGEVRASLRELEKVRDLNRSHYGANLLLYREYRKVGETAKADTVLRDLKGHKPGYSPRQRSPLDETTLFPSSGEPQR